MDELEKFINSIPGQGNKRTKTAQTTNPITDDLKNKPNFKKILKIFISERKKMWQSVLDFIELIEKEELKLKQLILYDVRYAEQVAQNNEEQLEKNDETEVQVDEFETSAMNRTFTKAAIKIDDNLYENGQNFDSFQNSLSDSTLPDNSFVNESIDLTPIPKPPIRKINQQQNQQKKKKRRSFCSLTLSTIQE